MNWTDERTEQLKVLWADGQSCSQIAAEMGGITRNAVIGKVHRLCLAKRLAKDLKPTQRRHREPREYVKAVRVRPSAHNVLFPVIEVVDVPVPDDMEIPIEQRKTLVEIENHHCHWPVGDPCKPDFFFCGDPTADVLGGRPYCAWHSRRAKGEPTPRSRKRQADNATYIPPRRRAA